MRSPCRSRPRYPASPVPSGAPCHLVARATPRSAQNRGRIFLCSDPKRLSRFGHHEASCAPRRARIPTQRPVFGLETPTSYQRQAKKNDHMYGVHKPTVQYHPVALPRDRAKRSASDRRSALAMRRSICTRAWAACSAALSASLVAFESANPATPTRRPP